MNSSSKVRKCVGDLPKELVDHRQLAAMKIKLEQSEAQLQAMAKASGLMPDSGKGSIEDAKLRQLEDELSKAQAPRLDRQSKLELASQASAESLPEILDNPTTGDYVSRAVKNRPDSQN